MERLRKMSKKELNKGITLIALVITIIVLLILAGVAIATLTGDNGILTKAVEAKKNTENASAKERIQIEVIGSYERDGTLNLDTLKSNISAHIPSAVIGGDTSLITVTLEGQTYTIDAGGNVELEGPIIEAEDIATNPDIFKKVTEGKVLNYGNTLKVTDAEGNQVDLDVEWKVFYAEGNDIYLIASDYVPVSKLASQKASLGFADNGNCSICWNSSDFKVTSINPTIASRFMLNELSKFTNTSNPNYKMTACLLDASKWETFRDTRWADENNVIGGPTLEMYTASWNKKYADNKLYTNTNSTGYYVGTSETPTTYSVDMSSTPGYSDALYYPHASVYNSCYGYWLASPSAHYRKYEVMVYDGGGVSGFDFNYSYYGVRPLVHLKSDIKLKSHGKDFVLVSE